MKKSLVIALLGLSCGALQSFAQGVILLDNYNTHGPDVTLNGAGVTAGWTFGFYYALGDATGSIAPDPTGEGVPSVLGPSLVLATGSGSTAPFYTSSFNTPGEAVSVVPFSVPGTSSAGGDTITLETIAYNGSSYTTSTIRGHSAAFTMTTSQSSSSSPHAVGSYMPGIAIVIPEPSNFALAWSGALGFLYFWRRRQADQS